MHAITKSARFTRARCPFCHDALDLEREATWACPRCRTPHHAPCARENGACTVLGCGEATGPGAILPFYREDEVVLPRVRRVHPSERLRTQLVAVLHVAAVVALVLIAAHVSHSLRTWRHEALYGAVISLPALLAPFVLRAAVLDIFWPEAESHLADLWEFVFELFRGQRR